MSFLTQEIHMFLLILLSVEHAATLISKLQNYTPTTCPLGLNVHNQLALNWSKFEYSSFATFVIVNRHRIYCTHHQPHRERRAARQELKNHGRHSGQRRQAEGKKESGVQNCRIERLGRSDISTVVDAAKGRNDRNAESEEQSGQKSVEDDRQDQSARRTVGSMASTHRLM